MINKILDELDIIAVKYNINSEDLDNIKNNIEDYSNSSITWSIVDFEDLAKQYEEYSEVELFDRTKFKDTLELMIRNHDCSLGITWETLHYYLEEYCEIEN